MRLKNVRSKKRAFGCEQGFTKFVASVCGVGDVTFLSVMREYTWWGMSTLLSVLLCMPGLGCIVYITMCVIYIYYAQSHVEAKIVF